ncbi:MAG: hypothetical protein AB8C84_08490 [Oligoflexales bacterium]
MKFFFLTFLVFFVSLKSFALPSEDQPRHSVWASVSSQASSWCFDTLQRFDPFPYLYRFFYQRPLLSLRALTHDVAREVVVGALSGVEESVGCTPPVAIERPAVRIDRVVSHVVADASTGVRRGLSQGFASPVIRYAVASVVVPAFYMIWQTTRESIKLPADGVLAYLPRSSLLALILRRGWFFDSFSLSVFDSYRENGVYVSRLRFKDFYEKAVAQNAVEWVFVSEDFLLKQSLVQRYLFLRLLNEVLSVKPRRAALVIVGSFQTPFYFMDAVDLSFLSPSISKFYIPLLQ